jgi:hypothetical protein
VEASSSPAQRTAAGCIPNSLREDFLRDVLVGWSRLEPDAAAWDVAGTMLAAAAALEDRAPCGGAAAAAALVDLSGAIEDCVHAAPDAAGRARAALERLLILLPQAQDAARAAR